MSPAPWDVVVVGAGPAGAVAAQAIAEQGASVLLVDRCVFPRRKACGCCLNAPALELLDAMGMDRVAERFGAPPLQELRLLAGGGTASVPLPGGAALSREVLDAALIRRAEAAGAKFLAGTEAQLGDVGRASRTVVLIRDSRRQPVQARVVLAADGLGGRLLRDEPACRLRASPSSWVGVSAVLPEAPGWVPPGTVVMACGSGGYVGLVQLEDRTLNVAAALAPSMVRARGAGQAVAALLARAGAARVEGLEQAGWHGAPALTRRRNALAAERVFVIGDSAGYVEPFTGEGIAWALASGLAAAPLALAARERWRPALMREWERRHRRVIGRRQWICRLLAAALRKPALTEAGIKLVSWWPGTAAPMVRATNTSFCLS